MRRPLTALSVAAVLAGTGLAAPAQAAPRQTSVVVGPGDVAAAVRAAGGTVVQALPQLHGAIASLPAGAVLPGFVVAPDRVLATAGLSSTATPDVVRATLAAPAGAGAGVTVAVVDTGVADVPQLAGRVTHVDVTGVGVGDGYGHGTFVAGLVAGTGTGVAPAARVLDVRVGHADGTTSLTEVMTGLEVVASHPEVRVVNVSLSSESPLDPEDDPLALGLEALWSMGKTVVVPAGNDGDARGTVASPGTDPLLLTVGGLDTAGTAGRADDTVAGWSSRGGRGVQKPDLVAPGAHVVSLAAPGSVIWSQNPTARVGDDRFVGSGSSFSTALASGAAAALIAARPSLVPDQVKALFTKTAYRVDGNRDATGDGGLDLGAALTAKASNGKQHAAGDGDGFVEWDANAWAANAWAARQWAARQWAARQWAARQWAARQWTARQWSALGWE